MAIQFQMRRGTAEEHATFTGAPGEITTDMSALLDDVTVSITGR